jgi:hypothetical protein
LVDTLTMICNMVSMSVISKISGVKIFIFFSGKGFNVARKDISGQVLGDYEKNAGPGGGWHARPDSALSAVHGASLLEGGRGGIPCYTARGFNFYFVA